MEHVGDRGAQIAWRLYSTIIGPHNNLMAKMAMIKLPYGGNEFNSDDLKAYLKTIGRDCIIQGQKACSRSDHPKPQSLDCWPRNNYAKNPDTKQAVNEVMAALVKTGDFKEGLFICPDSGRRIKGIRVLS